MTVLFCFYMFATTNAAQNHIGIHLENNNPIVTGSYVSAETRKKGTQRDLTIIKTKDNGNIYIDKNGVVSFAETWDICENEAPQKHSEKLDSLNQQREFYMSPLNTENTLNDSKEENTIGKEKNDECEKSQSVPKQKTNYPEKIGQEVQDKKEEFENPRSMPNSHFNTTEKMREDARNRKDEIRKSQSESDGDFNPTEIFKPYVRKLTSKEQEELNNSLKLASKLINTGVKQGMEDLRKNFNGVMKQNMSALQRDLEGLKKMFG